MSMSPQSSYNNKKLITSPFLFLPPPVGLLGITSQTSYHFIYTYFRISKRLVAICLNITKLLTIISNHSLISQPVFRFPQMSHILNGWNWARLQKIWLLYLLNLFEYIISPSVFNFSYLLFFFKDFIYLRKSKHTSWRRGRQRGRSRFPPEHGAQFRTWS